MKKVLSVLLTLAMIFSLIPMGTFTLTASALTKGYYTYTVTDGKATITDVDISISGDITIPSTLGGCPVTSIGTRAFFWCEDVTSVTIPDGVTSIGSSAFYRCSKLTSITIPDSVTSIGDGMFEGCTGLTSITIPNSVTYIGNNAFYYCTGLTSITIPNSVTYIADGAFSGCTGLEVIIIPDGVTSIGSSAFYRCSKLTSITIPDSVTSIGTTTFYNCAGLEVIIIPDGVTSIGGSAFSGCTGLTSITIPDSVTRIGYGAFSGCTGLTDVWYGGTEDDKAKISIGSNNDYLLNATWHYDNTKYYTYTVTDGKATITDVDTSISGDVTIPSTLGGYPVTSIGTRAFFWCEDVTSVTIPDGVTSIDEGAFDCCTNVQSITIPDSVTSIGERAFAWCENLTSITIPDGVTSIGESMFYCCSKLESITIPNGVTSIGRDAFAGCTSITSIVIPDGVTTISEYAFFDCQAMTSITLSDSVTSIGNYAFLDTGYYLNEDNWEDNVLYIGKHLIKANSSIIDDCIVKDGTLTIADYAFAFREELTGIVISNSVKNIGECAFGGCAALESITVDSGNTVFHSAGNCIIDTENKVLIAGCKNSNIPTDNSVTSIGNYAFYGNYEITSITIPDNITSIGWCSFAECGGLTEITIPVSITSIGEGAFEECAELVDVWYGGSMSDREKLDLADGNDYLIGSTWHYDFCKEHTYIGFFDRSCDSCGWERDDRSVPTSAHLLEMQQNMLGITNFPYGYFDINLDEYFNATDLVILQMFILGL